MKKKKSSKKTGASKGKTIVSLYADEKEIQQVQKRAKSLGLSVSKYFALLAVEDIKRGGALEISPVDE